MCLEVKSFFPEEELLRFIKFDHLRSIIICSLQSALAYVLVIYYWILFIFNGEYMVETTVVKMKIELVLRFPDIWNIYQ